MSRGQCPGPGKDKLPSFRARSKAKLLGSLRLGHEVAVSLLGAEPGSGEEQPCRCAREQAVPTSLTAVRTDCNVLLKFVGIAGRQSAAEEQYSVEENFLVLMPPECQKS